MVIAIATAWCLFIVQWGVLAAYELVNRRSRKIVTRRNFFGGLYLTGSVSTLFFWSMGEQIDTSSFADAIQAAGVFIAYGGLIFAGFARIRLDGAWSIDASIKEDMKLVSQFPYTLVRHPIYLGQIIMCLGSSMVSLNAFVFITLFCGTLAHHYWRACREEALLDEVTQGRYSSLFRDTGRIFPKFCAGKKGRPLGWEAYHDR